mmetsp:Transcript_11717/g.12871  ORF Transcript_11717/g.12871 Transcript_11717/m.12871 type:complete len:409 (+) Transcript_11717:69-1295(+)
MTTRKFDELCCEHQGSRKRFKKEPVQSTPQHIKVLPPPIESLCLNPRYLGTTKPTRAKIRYRRTLYDDILFVEACGQCRFFSLKKQGLGTMFLKSFSNRGMGKVVAFPSSIVTTITDSFIETWDFRGSKPVQLMDRTLVPQGNKPQWPIFADTIGTDLLVVVFDHLIIVYSISALRIVAQKVVSAKIENVIQAGPASFIGLTDGGLAFYWMFNKNSMILKQQGVRLQRGHAAHINPNITTFLSGGHLVCAWTQKHSRVSDDNVGIWNLNGKLLANLQVSRVVTCLRDKTAHVQYLHGLKDGRVAIGNSRSELMLWNPRTNKKHIICQGVQEPYCELPSGHLVVCGQDAPELLFVDLSSRTVLGRIHNAMLRDVTSLDYLQHLNKILVGHKHSTSIWEPYAEVPINSSC